MQKHGADHWSVPLVHRITATDSDLELEVMQRKQEHRPLTQPRPADVVLIQQLGNEEGMRDDLPFNDIPLLN